MVPLKDQTPQGDPETVVELPDGVVVGLAIRGLQGGLVMLSIYEDLAGQPVSCAVTNGLHIVSPTTRRHPRRQFDVDHWRDEGA